MGPDQNSFQEEYVGIFRGLYVRATRLSVRSVDHVSCRLDKGPRIPAYTHIYIYIHPHNV